MKFSQSKIISIVFLLAIMLIALMFSMYKTEGFYEGATGSRTDKNQDKRMKKIEDRVGTLEPSVGTLTTRAGTLETRVSTLESQRQGQSAAPYSSVKPAAPYGDVPATDEESSQ